MDISHDGKTLWVYTRHYDNVERVVIAQGKKPIKIFEPCEERPHEPWCKFRSEKNCDFCAFHSDCEIHWKDGDKE